MGRGATQIKLLVIVALVLTLLVSGAKGCGGCPSRRTPPKRHGGWSYWSGGSCSGGFKTWTRSCNNPSPAHGGNQCSGSRYYKEDCNECQSNNGRCQHVCTNSYGSYSCSCYSGYRSSEKKCDRITCRVSDWPKPSNGFYQSYSSCKDESKVNSGYSCRIGCNDGYKLDGPSSSFCGSSGTWSPKRTGNCKLKECNPLTAPDNGDITPSLCKSKPLHGQNCYYECNSGYIKNGPSSTKCNNGYWTSGSFLCQDKQPPSFGKTCPPEQSVFADEGKTTADVHWPPVKATDNDRASVTPTSTPDVTSPHVFPEGSHTVVFTATDTSGNKEFCNFKITVQVLRCPVFLPPSDGKLSDRSCGNLYGSVCRVECNRGFKLKGSPARTCDKNATNEVQWLGNATHCEVVQCPSLLVPDFATKSGIGCNGSASKYSTSCIFSCMTGYKAVKGSPKRTCLENGQWSGLPLVCKAIICSAVSLGSEGLVIEPQVCKNQSSSLAYATECRFSCKAGYQFLGPGIKTCSGKWLPVQNPSCKDISSPTFSNCSSNILVTADQGKTSTSVTWSTPTAADNSGVAPNVTRSGKQPGEIFNAGEHSVRYLATDTKGNIAECKFKIIVSVVRCVPVLYAPSGGAISCTKGTIWGSQCVFDCHMGHNMKGSAVRVCEKNQTSSMGYWTGNQTKCELAKCPAFVLSPHTVRSGCGGRAAGNVFGDKCLLYCDRGYYRVNGSTERVCQANGTWSGKVLHCQVVKCQPIQAPKDGHVTPNSCPVSPEYGTSCQFSCRKGFRLHGDPLISCLSSGKWSKNTSWFCKDVESPSFGVTCPRDIKDHADKNKNYTTVIWPPVVATDNSGLPPRVITDGVRSTYYEGQHVVVYNASDEEGNSKICKFYVTIKILRCQKLLPPLYGFFVEDCHDSYGSMCRRKCSDGYNLLGSENTTCETSPGHVTGYWTTPSPVCKVRSCSSLDAPKNGFIYPHMCTSYPISGTDCIFECRHGFLSSGGTTLMHCGKDGKWNKNESSIVTCLDVTPPIFVNCSSNIRASIGANGSADVNWTVPVAFDNSRLKPVVTVFPVGIHPPHIFNATTTIVYTARDDSGNTAKCSFKIFLEDNKGPEVVYCPPDQDINAVQMRTVVSWNEPQFKDNSNDDLVIRCSHKSGAQFYWGSWNVHCTAYDNNPDNDPAVCQFTVTLKPTPCPDLKPPKNGAKACDDWALGRYCSPFCNHWFDFVQPVSPYAMIWACDAKGVWKPTIKWPDCTKPSHPDAIKFAVRLHYFTGDCGTPEAKLQIQQQFIQILNTSIFNMVCRDPVYKDKCKAENVNVTFSKNCTKPDVTSRRKRRSIDDSVVEIAFYVKVDLADIVANGSKEDSKKVGDAGIELAKNISSVLKRGVNNGSISLTINGTKIQADKQSLNISDPEKICTSGQTFRDGYCLNCTSGTYLNKTLGTCVDCPTGSYQDLDAQEVCVKCPLKTSTTESRADDKSNCTAVCRAGSYSPTGLEPCLLCDKGFYQEKEQQDFCDKCGANQTTAAEGSNSTADCGVSCSAGSFSTTGLEPCTLCNRTSYQHHKESSDCIPCSGTTVTGKLGSKDVKDCIEINECDSDPCTNNATCQDLIGDYMCSCKPGYTGRQCEVDIDECQDLPCFNNGTCHDLVNNHTCSCESGFLGSNCEEDIDECVSSPCVNNASCQNFPGDYECFCQPGFTGKLCNVDINDCLVSPCRNGSTCVDKVNGYQCLCASGFQGTTCDENIDDCAADPCQNEASCVDGINSYHCICPVGFNGSNCETNINDCADTPCKNNATCIDQIGDFTCLCQKGFSGKTCDIDVDECLSNPCQNQARCVDRVNSFQCECQAGFDGFYCEENIDECATNPCSNNASCQDGVNDFTCICQAGFTGKDCQVDIDDCASTPCYNNASCVDGVNRFTCLCEDGFTGDRCGTNINECETATCLNNATCIDGINEYSCDCPAGFTGLHCEINVDDCAQNPCLNGGICGDLVGGYQCACRKGYTGKNCSVDIDECLSSPCQNNATCVDKVDNYTCICRDGFDGSRCEVNIDDCFGNTCRNGATCRDEIASYSCDCPIGFAGQFCDIDINECDSFPCFYGGTCQDKIGGFICTCKTGFTGLQCEVNIDDCKSNPCVNNGTCADRVANYSCSCPEGYHGDRCESRIDYCAHANCSQNGVCSNLLTGFNCDCTSGYYGKFCEFEIDECLAQPCFNNASCIDSIDNFTCSCAKGFTGRLCDVNIDDCLNSSCKNNATCVDHTLTYTCVCSDGYNGTYCETEVNECESDPCLNNGTCANLTPGYRCDCSDRFKGENCENLTNPCESGPCQHGATCNADNSTGNFSCACAAGFTGVLCDVNIDDCASEPCVINSYCIDLIDGYKCECLPSLTGDHCDVFLGSNFDLVFKRRNFADLVLLSDAKSVPDMRNFTVAMFVKANSQYKSGTLFSYSVPDVPGETIVLSFNPSQVQLKIKHETISADFQLASDVWHCVGVVWNGDSGNVSIYIDGKEVRSAQNVLKGSVVTGSGWVALGQRYLAGKSESDLSTSFVGTLHQVNLWDVAATADHMWNAAQNCTWPIGGSVHAWSGFLFGIQGKVEKRFQTKCKALTKCTTKCAHFNHCETRNSYYNCSCQAGFSGPHCNINTNDCVSSPCVHGTCVDGVNRFDCVCDKGFWGEKCEKQIVDEEECPQLGDPSNGLKSCRKASGRKLCTLSCKKGYSFGAETITTYGCGPDTEWQWNREKDVKVPRCSKESSPREIEHSISLEFPGIQCKDDQNLKELRSQVDREIRKALSPIPSCNDSTACSLTDVQVPSCQSTNNQRTIRAIDDKLQILISLVIKGSESTALEDTIEERSEAVLFQMQYAVSTGQFRITVGGMNSTADRSSFQHVSSHVTCSAGFVLSSDRKGCVSCAEGTFFNKDEVKCEPCSTGTYQDTQAQLSCKPCDEKQTTVSEGATTKQACVASKETDVPYVLIGLGVLAAVVLVVAGVLYIRYRPSCCRIAATPQSTRSSSKHFHNDTGKGRQPKMENQDLHEKRNVQENPQPDKEHQYAEIEDIMRQNGKENRGFEDNEEAVAHIQQEEMAFPTSFLMSLACISEEINAKMFKKKSFVQVVRKCGFRWRYASETWSQSREEESTWLKSHFRSRKFRGTMVLVF